MRRGERRFKDGERSSVEVLGGFPSALRLVQDREIVQRQSDVYMREAEQLLFHRQGTVVVTFRRNQSAGGEGQCAHVIQRYRHLVVL